MRTQKQGVWKKINRVWEEMIIGFVMDGNTKTSGSFDNGVFLNRFSFTILSSK